jgi:hypothetical protein
LSEKVLGAIKVNRPYWGWNIFEWSSIINEELVFTSDRVLVIRKWSEYVGGSVGATDVVTALMGAVSDAIETSESKRRMWEREKQIRTLKELLKADKNNYAIPNTAIQKIEIKSRKRFHITTTNEKHKWYLTPKKTEWTKSSIHEDVRNLENILRPIFGDKLSVKK